MDPLKANVTTAIQHYFETGTFTTQRWVHKIIDALIPDPVPITMDNVDEYFKEGASQVSLAESYDFLQYLR